MTTNVVTYEKPDQAQLDNANAMFVAAQHYEITSAPMYEAAASDLKSIKALQKDLDTKKHSVLKPLTEAVNALRGLFKGPEQYLEQAESILKTKMVTYTREEERKRKEAEAVAAAAARKEQERIAREAAAKEAKARADAEALRQKAEAEAAAGNAAKAASLQAKADAKETDGAAQAADLMEQAAMMPTTVVMPVATPRVSGQSMRGSWKVKSVSLAELVQAAAKDPQYLAYLKPNDVAINGAVRAQKEHASIPGVVTYEDFTIASRAA